MAVPTPPTAGEPIAEAWGDVVHDQVVARDFQGGAASITGNGGPTADVTVTFSRPFASTPVAQVSAIGGQTYLAGIVSVPSTTQLVIRLFKRDGSNIPNGTGVNIHWLAWGSRT